MSGYSQLPDDWEPPRMPWYIDWFCEWLSLIQSLCIIATFCRFNPQIETAFLSWWNARQEEP